MEEENDMFREGGVVVVTVEVSRVDALSGLGDATGVDSADESLAFCAIGILGGVETETDETCAGIAVAVAVAVVIVVGVVVVAVDVASER